MSCNERIRSELAHNIFLSGGNTLFDGFAGRLYKELKNIFPSIYDI